MGKKPADNMPKGKNLANCTPKEFAVQTRLIKHAVEKWLTETDVMKIRQTKPVIPEGATDEEVAKLMREQATKNLSAMFDAVMDEHPDETVELLGLLCFVPPAEVDNYPMSYYMDSIGELLSEQSVWNFFTSLLLAARRLGITQA